MYCTICIMYQVMCLKYPRHASIHWVYVCVYVYCDTVNQDLK